jgi:transposase
MHPPLFSRALIKAERRALEAARRSRDAFSARRSRIVLLSAAGSEATQIAENLGCAPQTVRNALHAFHAEGLASLKRQSNRPKSAKPALDEAKRERLSILLKESPRAFGKERSDWTLELVAQVAHEEGLSAQRLSAESVRVALKRLGLSFARAKRWIGSPDPAYARKKSGATL